MNSYQIEVVEPIAVKLLEDMAKQNLIKLLPVEPKERFKQLLSKLRASEVKPSFEEITTEVESVREQKRSRRNEN